MTWVKNTFPTELWEAAPDCGEGVETLGVQVFLQMSSLLLVNLYHPAAATLELGELFTVGSTSHLVLGGDFNAHHPALQSSSAPNAAGNEVALVMEEYNGLHLLNSAEPTHIGGVVFDLTYVLTSLLPCAERVMAGGTPQGGY